MHDHLNSLTISEDEGSVKVCVTFQHQAMEEFVEFYITVKARLGIGGYLHYANFLKVFFFLPPKKI